MSPLYSKLVPKFKLLVSYYIVLVIREFKVASELVSTLLDKVFSVLVLKVYKDS
nr:MAG TPA: hypothetical protein [Bacteriophage sp.]